jgi:SAM-dependent methyltransferase
MLYSHSEKIHNLNSPKVILPLVFKFVKPNSIIDVGCGIGTWLNVAKSLGVEYTLGVDGDYVDKYLLSKYISLSDFKSADLSNPFNIEFRFDLCICLEVAEHLPEKSSINLIKTLVDSADVILFSAAIPGQGGQNHLNEQWPNYWASIFKRYNYFFLDIIRPLIWENNEIEYWYKQNIFLVVKEGSELLKNNSISNHSLIHPDLFNLVYKESKRYYTKTSTLKNEVNLIHSGGKSFYFYLKLFLKFFISKL